MSENPARFRAFVVEQFGQHVHGKVQERRIDQLPAGDVLIRVSHSSLNYKDAMAATGHKGIVKTFPHVPGIDAAGVVVESSVPSFKPGDEVIATGREIGVERWGGWSEYLRVPAGWVQRVPEGLTRVEAMMLGTAGFTAAQCVAALVEHGRDAGAGRSRRHRCDRRRGDSRHQDPGEAGLSRCRRVGKGIADRLAHSTGSESSRAAFAVRRHGTRGRC